MMRPCGAGASRPPIRDNKEASMQHLRIPRPFPASLGALAAAAAFAQAPVAPVRNVPETMHGTQVNDPYRYMEDLKDPAVQAWMKGQGAAAGSTLDRIEGRVQLQERIAEIQRSLGDSRRHLVRTSGGGLFYMHLPRN